MVTGVFDLVGSLREPEHTGANRCRPCTVINLLIAIAIAGGLSPLSVPLAIGFLVVSVGLIYVRGYLVPGTPRLTQRYLPAWVLRRVGKSRPDGSVTGLPDDVAVPASIRQTESRHATGSERLSASFRDDWLEAVRRLHKSDEVADEVATILDIDPADVTFGEYDDGFTVSVTGTGAARWPSRTALLVDLAASRELPEMGVADLDTLHDLISEVVWLRAGLERCPVCEDELVTAERTAVACCGASNTTVMACESCESRIFEADPDRSHSPHS